MKHFSEVPVPKLIQDNCEKSDRGLYVPFIVLKEGGTHHFKMNDFDKEVLCIQKRLCSVCGTALHDDTWFIGGPGSVFHRQGAIADLPVHKACGEYSLQVCPYLAYARYSSKTDVNKLYDKFKSKGIYVKDVTVDPDRVPMFCFVKASGYSVHMAHAIVFKPVTPYLEVEFWNDGQRLSTETGEQILAENFRNKYSIEDLNYTYVTKNQSQKP